MFQSIKVEKAELQTALKKTIYALRFYADPDAYMVRLNSPRKTSIVVIDGGKMARLTLDDLKEHLDPEAWSKLRRAQFMAGDLDYEDRD